MFKRHFFNTSIVFFGTILTLYPIPTRASTYGLSADINGNLNVDGNVVIDGTLDVGGVQIPQTDSGNDISTNTSNISTNTTNIKNLGEGVAGSTALSAALSSLPQKAINSNLNCGSGIGSFSNKVALGVGCASKKNERLDINAGGSFLFDELKSYGDKTLDNSLFKAGFVLKLGKIDNGLPQKSKDGNSVSMMIQQLNLKNQELDKNNKRLEDLIVSQKEKLEGLEKLVASFDLLERTEFLSNR